MSEVDRRAWVGAAVGTMCSALPMFMTGALGVQIRDELDLSATQIGVAMGVSFGCAALLSAPMGRVAQRVGATRAFRAGLTTTALSMLAIAATADRFWKLCALLAVAGVANALNQPAANLLLSIRIAPHRLGLALATKQSGMPAAALVGGIAVPAVALTLGWQWAYVFGGALTLVVAAFVIASDGHANERLTDRLTASVRRTASRAVTPARPDLGVRLLTLYAVVGLLGSTNAGAMVGFITSGAEESGLAPGLAGLVLSLASFTGIASRMYQGWQVDNAGILPIQRLMWLYGLGALSVLLLAVDVPATYVVASLPSFAFGWAWPGLFNLSVIRNNPSAPATATGISQVGVFAGAALGPAAGGVVIDQGGYRLLWILGSITLMIGAVLAAYLRTRIRANAALTPTPAPI